MDKDGSLVKAERPFRFYDCVNVVKSTGVAAVTLSEFLEGIRKVPSRSIFYHIHQSFLRYHFDVPDYPNDFSEWAAKSLEDKVLAEKLANITPYDYKSVDEVREKIILIIREHYRNLLVEPVSYVGEKFFFCESTTLVFPTEYEAWTLRDFGDHLQKVEPSSVYYHFFEARLKSERGLCDFCVWFAEELKMGELAQRLCSVDPYMFSLEELRTNILQMVNDELEAERQLRLRMTASNKLEE